MSSLGTGINVGHLSFCNIWDLQHSTFDRVSLSSHFLLWPCVRNMDACQGRLKPFFQTKPLFNHLSLKDGGLQCRATQREAKEGTSPVRHADLPSFLAGPPMEQWDSFQGTIESVGNSRAVT